MFTMIKLKKHYVTSACNFLGLSSNLFLNQSFFISFLNTTQFINVIHKICKHFHPNEIRTGHPNVFFKPNDASHKQTYIFSDQELETYANCRIENCLCSYPSLISGKSEINKKLSNNGLQIQIVQELYHQGINPCFYNR